MRPLTHNTHKLTWSHVCNTVWWDHWHIPLTNTKVLMFTTMYHETIDTWHSEIHKVSSLQQCIMRPLTHGTQKHTWSHVYSTVGWDHWYITPTNSHGLMSTTLLYEIIDILHSLTLVSCLQYCISCFLCLISQCGSKYSRVSFLVSCHR